MSAIIVYIFISDVAFYQAGNQNFYFIESQGMGMVFKKAENFLKGATRDSDEEVPIFSEAVLALKDADSALIEDPIFSGKEAIGAGPTAASDFSVWAASI